MYTNIFILYLDVKKWIFCYIILNNKHWNNRIKKKHYYHDLKSHFCLRCLALISQSKEHDSNLCLGATQDRVVHTLYPGGWPSVVHRGAIGGAGEGLICGECWQSLGQLLTHVSNVLLLLTWWHLRDGADRCVTTTTFMYCHSGQINHCYTCKLLQSSGSNLILIFICKAPYIRKNYIKIKIHCNTYIF